MYTEINNDILDVFATPEFKATNILIVPEEYDGDLSKSDEYCQLYILFGQSLMKSFGAKNKEISGIVTIMIYVNQTLGSTRAMEISDTLDNFLENKRLTNKTELGASYVVREGRDQANSQLMVYRYVVQLKKYGD